MNIYIQVLILNCCTLKTTMRLRSNKTLKNKNKFKHRNNNTKLNKQSKRDWNDNETVSHGNFVKFGFILHDSWISENHFEI